MCLPALGSRLKLEIDEIEKPVRAYMLAIATSAKNPPKSNLPQKPTMASNHDMFR